MDTSPSMGELHHPGRGLDYFLLGVLVLFGLSLFFLSDTLSTIALRDFRKHVRHIVEVIAFFGLSPFLGGIKDLAVCFLV
jgi:hypothetical protein